MALKLLLISLRINIGFNQIGRFPMMGDREQPEFGETVLTQ